MRVRRWLAVEQPVAGQHVHHRVDVRKFSPFWLTRRPARVQNGCRIGGFGNRRFKGRGLISDRRTQRFSSLDGARSRRVDRDQKEVLGLSLLEPGVTFCSNRQIWGPLKAEVRLHIGIF